MADEATAAVDAAEQVSAKLPGGGQTGNRRLLKALVIGPEYKRDAVGSKQIPQDDFLENLAADGRVIQPPLDKLVLAMLPENSTSLAQVIEAMVNNIEGFGHRFECRVRIDDKDCPPEIRKAALAERIMLANFFNNAAIVGGDKSFISIRKKKRWDEETTGEGYWEAIRTISNRVVGFSHIPSYQVRLGTLDKEFTTYKRVVSVLKEDGSVELEAITLRQRFRRFVQCRIGTISRAFAESSPGYDVRWFKEFGDPRVIDNRTGEVVPEGTEIAEEYKASEIIHWRHYSPRTPYGLPRHVGNLVTLFGDRAADEVNFTTLRNNNIPSMMVLVSNGQLTDASIQRIREYTESQIAGSDNYSRFLLVEGEGSMEGSENGMIKIEVKPLTSEQMRDQLFQEYSKNNHDKVRECYRLPPIFVGRSDDYTRATAETSRRLADEQVFKPERDEFDSWMNTFILPELGVRFHRFVSNSPNITDDEDLIKVLVAAEKTGGLTPELARIIIADILGRDLPPMNDADFDQRVPFSLTLAEKVKNQAGMEVGTQITAVKAIADRMASLPTSGRSPVQDLLAIRATLEAELARRLGGETDS